MADDLQVILKAKELMVHTLRITSNANRYPKKYVKRCVFAAGKDNHE